MSDSLSYLKSKSEARTPIKNSQAPSNFVERVNKVNFTQIFQTSKKPQSSERATSSDKERFQSPFFQKKMESLNNTLYALNSKISTRNSIKRTNKIEVELAGYKLNDIIKKSKKHVFDMIRKDKVYRDNDITHKNPDLYDIKKVIQDCLKEQYNINQLLAFTKCKNCGHSGLSLLTSSTRDKLSPRFMEKVTQLLPNYNTGCDKENINPNKKYLETLKCQDFEVSSSFESNRNIKSPNFSSLEKNKVSVPKLNFTSLSTVSNTNKYKSQVYNQRSSIDVLKGSPHQQKFENGLKLLGKTVAKSINERIHTGFDLIFLSRAQRDTEENQSLTFEFSPEESAILSNRPGLMTGNFVTEQTLNDISIIEQQEKNEISYDGDPQEDISRSSVYIKSSNLAVFKILYSRLDKLFYRRKVRGFYSLMDTLY